MADRSREAKQRRVVFRHRVVLEFETYGTTGYNGDVEYLVNHGREERYRYTVNVLPRSRAIEEVLRDIKQKPPVIVKEATTVVSVEVET